MSPQKIVSFMPNSLILYCQRVPNFLYYKELEIPNVSVENIHRWFQELQPPHILIIAQLGKNARQNARKRKIKLKLP